MKDEAVGVQTSKGFQVDPIAESQLFELDLFFELVLLQFKKKYLDHEVHILPTLKVIPLKSLSLSTPPPEMLKLYLVTNTFQNISN